MPINKSLGREMDKRTRELEKKSPGTGSQALQEQQLAQNQLQAIQNEQRSNLMSQRTEAAAMDQQNQLLSQAAELGVSESTAATLGKYGMRTPPRVQQQQGRQVKITPNKITIINNNTTTTTNNVQQEKGSEKNNSVAKFRTWLGNVNMQQAEQASKRDRDYARRESSLTRSANKMLRRIEKVGSSVAEAFSPQTFGQTLGSQLKMYLLIFGMKFLSKYWDKVLYMIDWIGKKFQDFTAWLGIGEKGKAEAAQGRGLVPTVIRLLGGKPGKETVADAFRNSLKAAFDHFSLKLDHMMEERAEAMKKVKLNINTDGALGGILKGLGLEGLFQGITTYLGDILTALVNPRAGAARQVSRNIQKKGLEGSAQHMNTAAHESAAFGIDKGDLAVVDKSNKKRYGLIEGAVGPGNILTSKAGGQVSQSLDVIGAIREAKETGYVDPARFLSGLERMQNKARTSGYIAVDYEFLTTFLSPGEIRNLTTAKHIRLRKYKVVKVRKASAHGIGDYIAGAVGLGGTIRSVGGGEEASALTSNAVGLGKKMHKKALVGGASKAAAGLKVATRGAGMLASGAKLLSGPYGMAASLAIGAGITAVEDFMDNDNTLEFVPLDDPREAYKGMVQILYEIDEYVLKQIAKKLGADRFDTSNEKLMSTATRYIMQRAGGQEATRRRYGGKGSNVSINIAEEYKSVHEFDNLRAAHKREEESDEFNQRIQTSKNEVGRIVGEAKDAGKQAYQNTKDFFTKPTGDKPEVLYSPSRYKSNSGYGTRAASSVESYVVPPTPKYGEINKYTGGGILKSPLSTDLTFSTEAAVKEALRLSKLIITEKAPSRWKPKSSTAKGKSTFLATYPRLAIAKGLGKNDLSDHPKLPCDFVHILYKYGFCPLEWSGYSPRKGDICVFGPTPNKFKGGYVSIFTGNKWVSDHEQLDMWPDDEFRANRTATVFRHLKTISDKSYGDLLRDQYDTDAGFGESGFVDFDGDGKWDAMKTEDGSFYKINEDGTLEKLSADQVSSMWNGNSVFASSSRFGDSDYSSSSGVTGFVGGAGPSHYDSWTLTKTGFGNNKWANAVMAMGAWYKAHVPKYVNAPSRGCQLLKGGQYRPDCSGFVSACLVLYGIPVYDPQNTKGERGGPCARHYCGLADANYSAIVRQKMEAGGFTLYERKNLPGGLQPWDIRANFKHIEISADGRDSVYNAGSTNAIHGMPSNDKPFSAKYTHVWRCTSTPSGVGTNSLLDSKGDSVNFGAWDAPADLSSGSGAGYTGGGGVGYVAAGGSYVSGGSSYGWTPTNTTITGTGAAININDPIVQSALAHTGGYAKGQQGDFIRDEYLAFRAAGMSHAAAIASVAQDIQESGFGTSAAARQGNNYSGISAMKKRGINPYKAGTRWGGFQNLGHYAAEKKALLDRMYKGASTAQSAEEYARILQGVDANGNVNRQYAWCATETSGGVHSDRLQYVNQVLNHVDRVNSVVSQNIDIPDADPTTQAISNTWNAAEQKVGEGVAKVQGAYDAVKSAISNALPQQSKFITFEKDFDKQIEAMSDDQLAAQVWLNNASVRSQYDAYGFEGWRKNVFNKLSRSQKKRYLVEEEGKDLIARTSTASDGKGYMWSGINNFLGGNLSSDLYNNRTGELTEKGLAYVGSVYAKLSPEERKQWAARLKLESDWRDIVNDIKLKSKTGFSEDDRDYMRNLFGIKNMSDEAADSLYTDIQFGNKDALRRNLKSRSFWSFRDGEIDEILSRVFAQKQYAEVDEGLKGIVNSDKFNQYLKLADVAENSSYNLDNYSNALGVNKEFAERYFARDKYANWWDELKESFKGNDIYYKRNSVIMDDMVNFLDNMYQLSKGKYVQQNLTNGFESISEFDTATSAYEKQRRNDQRAEVNKKKYDLEYQKEHWQEDYYHRMQHDDKFRQDLLWNYGVGEEANQARYESDKGKEELEELDNQIAELNKQLDKINGSTELQDTEAIKKKFAQTKADVASGAVVDPEEIKRVNLYMKSGAEVFEETFNRKFAELQDIKEGKDETYEEKNERDRIAAAKEAQKAKEAAGEEVWRRLVEELTSGKLSTQEARVILDTQGIGRAVTNEQLLNIQKSKAAGAAPQQIERTFDENGNLVTRYLGADGREIMVEDYEYDDSGNKVIDKKTGKPKKIKRAMKTSDTEAIHQFMENSDLIQSARGVGNNDVTLIKDGRTLTLGETEDGQWVYYDPTTGEAYYDRNGNPLRNSRIDPETGKEVANTSSYSNVAPGLAAAAESMPYSYRPNIVQNVSQTTDIMREHMQSTIDEKGLSYHGFKFTKDNLDGEVKAHQVDLSKYKEYNDKEEVMKLIAEELGTSLENMTGEMKAIIEDQLEENPNGKLEISTANSGGKELSYIKLPDGKLQLVPNTELAEVGIKNFQQQAVKLGFASQEAKAYAETIKKEEFAQREVQRKLSEGQLTTEGLTVQTLQQILQEIANIPSWIRANGDPDQKAENDKKDAEKAAKEEGQKK